MACTVRRLRRLTVVLWRAGLRIDEALALREADLDRRRVPGSFVAVREDDVASSGYREPRTQRSGRLEVDADDFPRFPVGTPPKGVVWV